ncbi:MAG: hypothetical protein IJD26_03830 [Lachnospiraceae bacterium]|nr:hypothetical protein [Lachnospiraceae bacterium]
MKQWMKKSCKVAVVMMSMAVICGCGSKEKDLQPYEWSLDGAVISYYDSAEDIDEELCQKYDSYFEGAQSDSTTWVLVNEDSEIRAFITEDSSVATYNGISVGDALSVVEDSFSYEETYTDNCYMVYFDGETEMDAEEVEPEDDWILITYFAEEGMITEITVYDGVFGSSMQ